MNFAGALSGKEFASTPGWKDLRNVHGSDFCIVQSGKMPHSLCIGTCFKNLSKRENKQLNRPAEAGSLASSLILVTHPDLLAHTQQGSSRLTVIHSIRVFIPRPT